MSNSDIVRDFVEAFNSNDLDRIVSFFSSDAVYHNIPVDPVQGSDAIRAVIQGYTAAASKMDWVIHQIAETLEGVVLTERTDNFQFGDRRVSLRVMGAFEIADGKISAWRDYFDMAQFQSKMSA